MQMLNCVYPSGCRHVYWKREKEEVRLRKRRKEKIPESPGWKCNRFLTKASYVITDVIINPGNLSVRGLGVTFDQDLSFNSHSISTGVLFRLHNIANLRSTMIDSSSKARSACYFQTGIVIHCFQHVWRNLWSASSSNMLLLEIWDLLTKEIT